MINFEEIKEGQYASYVIKSYGERTNRPIMNLHIGRFMTIKDGKAVFDRCGEPLPDYSFFCVQVWDYIEDPHQIINIFEKVK